jgi:predicted ATPase
MLGTVVNQAAYLMGAACNSILCDTATYQLSRSRIIFTQRSSIQIKSRSETLPAYMPERQAHRQARANQRLVGHNSERMLITTHLHALAHQQPAYPPAGKDTTGRATLIILEGEVGVGKSLLVDDMCAQAKSLGLLVLSGAGNAMEQQTSYYPWREVFRHLLGLDISSSREMQQQCVLNAVAHLPDLIPLVSLLNTILPLELPESAQAAALRGEPRAQALHRLSVQVLQASTTQAPAVLVLDDAHWLDPASWALVQAVVQQVPSLLVVLSIRQQHETVPTVLHSLLQHPQTHHLPLRALSLEETLTLACERLGTAQVPESLVSLIYDQAHGNPFFSEEVMYALRDAGLITVHNGVCHVASEAELSGALRSSETIQAVITSRLDRLSLNEQITLKIASVVGHVFTFRMLRDVHPMKPEQRRLARDVVSLQRLNFLEAAEHTPEPTYRFKQNITQEVVYNLMSFAQRRQIHRAVASWYEQNHAGHLGELAPLLSKHFSRAGDERALPYCICAGDEALAADATREALLHYTRAYELIRHLPTRQAHSLEPASIIHLFLQRGRALELESQYQQALANYRTLEDIAHQQQDRHMRLAALIARATLHALPTSTCDPPQVQQLLHNALELSRELK